MIEQGKKTSLMVAAEHDKLDLVHYLVDRGASIEAVDEVCGPNVMIIDV
jgi:hypothetical protein